MIFSGRRDPEWDAGADVVRRAMEIWERLKPLPPDAAPHPPPALGYRGSVLRDAGGGGRRWTASGGVVTLTERGAPTGDARRDEGAEFENLLLASAPPGVLPPGIGPRTDR